MEVDINSFIFAGWGPIGFKMVQMFDLQGAQLVDPLCNNTF